MRHTQKNLTRLIWGIPLALLMIFPRPARSNTIFVFDTAPGATVGGQHVNIHAIFTLDPINHLITLDIINLQKDIARDFQALSSVQIAMDTLNGSPTAPTVQSSSFSEIDVTSTSNPPTVTSPKVANAWRFPTAGAYSVGSSTTLTFCTNCPTQGNGELIIGGPNPSNGLYDAGNPSLYNTPHQPYILGSGDTYSSGPFTGLDSSPEWILNVPQLSANTTITGVTFGFGTAWGTNTTLGQNDTPTPEPGAASLVFTGGLLIGVSVFLRRRKPASPRG